MRSKNYYKVRSFIFGEVVILIEISYGYVKFGNVNIV